MCPCEGATQAPEASSCGRSHTGLGQTWALPLVPSEEQNTVRTALPTRGLDFRQPHGRPLAGGPASRQGFAHQWRGVRSAL